MQEFLQQLINGVVWGSAYALIALGYTMVYGILRLINFAHGDVYMMGAYVAYFIGLALGASATHTLMGGALILAGAMAGSAVLGFCIERFIYRPLSSAPRLTLLIAAIGVSLFLEYFAQLQFGSEPRLFPQFLRQETVFQMGRVTLSNQQALVVIVSILLGLGLQYIVHLTSIGRAMRAVSFDREAAALMGISVNTVVSFTFVLGSALAAAAAVLISLNNPQILPFMGIQPGLKAFVAAVLGGIGNVWGAIAGGLLMGIAETMVVGYGQSSWRDGIVFAILIVVLLVKPTGLFGSPVTDRA
ncbi:MAG: branched-chain amino acid ABC transporter permease [Armatimonadetes bacterium]|nr:branched-chain amino acid ABC transporter permease [Armatimonadota bacterium]